MNYTIYIASDLDKHDRFHGEENKSGLVNMLLRKHYSIHAPKQGVGKVREEVQVLAALPNPFTERKNSLSSGYCKNGHPIPEGREKCLGKGCKYS